MAEVLVAAVAPGIRPGARVYVNGRLAAFLYARRNGAVIRYEGERQSRVVALYKLEPISR